MNVAWTMDDFMGQEEELANAANSFITSQIRLAQSRQLHEMLENNFSWKALRKWFDFVEQFYSDLCLVVDWTEIIIWRHPSSRHTAYTLAVKLQRTEIIRLFCEYGADMERIGSVFLAVFSVNTALLQFSLNDCSVNVAREWKYLPKGQWGRTLKDNVAPTARFADVIQVLLRQPLGQLYLRDLLGEHVCPLVIASDTTVKTLRYMFLLASNAVLCEQIRVVKLFDLVCSVRRLDLVDCVIQHVVTSSGRKRQPDCLFSLLTIALKKNYLPAIRLLLAYDSALVKCRNRFGATCLMLACYLCKSLELIRFLCAFDRTVVNMTDPLGYSALNYAVFGNHLPAVRYLVEVAQIDFNVQQVQDSLQRACLLGTADFDLTLQCPVATAQVLVFYLQQRREDTHRKRQSAAMGVQQAVVVVFVAVVCLCVASVGGNGSSK